MKKYFLSIGVCVIIIKCDILQSVFIYSNLHILILISISQQSNSSHMILRVGHLPRSNTRICFILFCKIMHLLTSVSDWTYSKSCSTVSNYYSRMFYYVRMLIVYLLNIYLSDLLKLPNTQISCNVKLILVLYYRSHSCVLYETFV